MNGLTGTKGGSGVWQRIISEMPYHKTYVEPFWGRGTLAKKKLPARLTIGCDLDPAAVSDGREFGAQMFFCCGLAFSDGLFGFPDTTSDPASHDRASTAASGSPRRCTSDIVSGVRAASAAPDDVGASAALCDLNPGIVTVDRGAPDPGAFHRDLASPEIDAATSPNSRLPATPYPAIGAAGIQSGARGTLDRATGDDVARAAPGFLSLPFVYFDPPYHEVRSYYSTVWDDSGHERLISLFLNLPVPAALSGYATRLYRDRLKGVRRIEIPTVNRAGRRCVEVLWLNYDEPKRYHDTRFVGVGRRQRERIRRRVRNWTRGLANLPTNERQAVFSGLSQTFLGGGAGGDAGSSLDCGCSNHELGGGRPASYLAARSATPDSTAGPGESHD